jgi:hypothetical protein
MVTLCAHYDAPPFGSETDLTSMAGALARTRANRHPFGRLPDEKFVGLFDPFLDMR